MWRSTEDAYVAGLISTDQMLFEKMVLCIRKKWLNLRDSLVLFSTLDQLINTTPLSQSAMKCEELALFFDDKMAMVRVSTVPDFNDTNKP